MPQAQQPSMACLYAKQCRIWTLLHVEGADGRGNHFHHEELYGRREQQDVVFNCGKNMNPSQDTVCPFGWCNATLKAADAAEKTGTATAYRNYMKLFVLALTTYRPEIYAAPRVSPTKAW